MMKIRDEMSETMRKAIESVIKKDDKEACLNMLGDALDEFKIAYRDKLHALIAFNSCLVKELMKILIED